MASPASVGQSLAQAIGMTRMGERAAVKLEFTEVGLVSPEVGIPHNTILTAQALSLPTFPVPNTAIPGDLNFGKLLFADAEVVTGGLAAAGETDFYKFNGSAGDIINAEVLSVVPNRFGSFDIDPMIRIFRQDGITVVPQGAGVAFNDDEFESLDSALIDIVLPATETYYVQVLPFSSSDTGNYELYLYRFRAIPEPAAISLVIVGVIAVASTKRRMRRA
jgi:hypothetical protein